MSDLARLGIQVESDSVSTADTRLRRLPSAARDAEKSIDKVGTASSGAGAALRSAAVQLGTFLGTLASVRKALAAADQYSNMQNRLLALGNSHAQASSQIAALAEVAKNTRAPLEATAGLYTRLALTSDSLGASQDELMQFTETVGLALAASGTSAGQASGALTQLSQAMAGGVVRAEEFNSIMEGAPGLLIAVSQGIDGVDGDIGKLREMMLAGELTSEKFFDAMLSQSEALQEAFGNTTPTISQAMTVLNDAFTLFVGQADQASGVTTAIANAMLVLAENMDVAIPVFGAVVVAIAALAAPISAALIAIGGLTVAVAANWDTIKETFASGVQFFKDIGTSAYSALLDLSLTIAKALDGALEAISMWGKAAYDTFVSGLEKIRDFGADLVKAIKQMGVDAFNAALQIGSDIVAGIRQGISRKWEDLKSYVSGLGTGMLDGIKDTLGIRSPSREFAEVGRWSVEGLVVGIDDNAAKAVDRARELGGEIGKGVRDGLEPVLATVFDGLVRGDIRGVGTNLLGMAQSSFSGLLQKSFGLGGTGFTGLVGGLKTSVQGIGTALSGAGGLITKLGGAFSAALPVIGLVSTAISFFKTKTTELDAGLRVAVSGMDAMVETFRTVEKVKFFGLSKKVRTSTELADYEIASPIQAAVNSIGERVTELADVLGLASGNIAKTTFDFEISTKGKSDSEIQEAIAAEMTRLGNSFADAVIGTYTEFLPDDAEIARLTKQMDDLRARGIGGRGGDDRLRQELAQLEAARLAAETSVEVTHLNDALSGLQREGEGSLDMLERLVSDLGGVNEALVLFGRQLLSVDIAGAAAATALVELSGGLEAFTAKSQYIFDNFLTDAGRDARLTEIALEQLTATFGDLKFAIPDTHDQFMALRDAQDLTTEAGRQTYAALNDVAAAFVQVNGTAQEAADAIRASRAAEVEAAQAVLSNRAQAATAGLSAAEAALRRAFQAEKDRLSGIYQDQLDAARAASNAARAQADASISAAQDRVILYRSIRDALERAYTDRRVLTAIGQQMRLSEATSFLRTSLASGGVSDLDRLREALDTVADPSTDLFDSFEAYQQAFNVNTNLIKDLGDQATESLSIEERMLTGINRQRDAITDGATRQVDMMRLAHESQLGALDSQLAALLGIDNSVLSLSDAIGAFKAAEKVVAQETGATPEPATQFQAGSFGARLDAAYQQYLGRGVRQPGLDFYGGLWANGTDWETILSDIIYSDEAKQFRATGIPRFDGGGFTGWGARSGGLDGQGGFWAMLHPRESVIDHTKPPMASGGRLDGEGSRLIAQKLDVLNKLTEKVEARLEKIDNATRRTQQVTEEQFQQSQQQVEEATA